MQNRPTCPKIQSKVPFGKRGAESKIMLKWMLRRQAVRAWTGFDWLKIRSNGGLMQVSLSAESLFAS
jgi:hypothetical protein